MSVNLARSSPLTSLASAAPSSSATQSSLSSLQLQCRPCYERPNYKSLQGKSILFVHWLNFSQNTTQGWIFLGASRLNFRNLWITYRAQEFIARMNKFPAEVQSWVESWVTQCPRSRRNFCSIFNRPNLIMQSLRPNSSRDARNSQTLFMAAVCCRSGCRNLGVQQKATRHLVCL